MLKWNDQKKVLEELKIQTNGLRAIYEELCQLNDSIKARNTIPEEEQILQWQNWLITRVFTIELSDWEKG